MPTTWDTHVLWEGTSSSLWRRFRHRDEPRARYRLTRDALHFEILGDDPSNDVLPLWIVLGADVSRSPLQLMLGVGDVKLRLDPTVRAIQTVAFLSNVADVTAVRELVVEQADRVRRDALRASTPDVGPGRTPHIGVAREALPLTQQLRELAALRDSGILTEDEFQAQKAKLLAD